MACLVIIISVAGTPAESRTARESPLVKLATARFPNLTKCERTILEYADIRTTPRGDAAACGPSSKFDDPTNDPKGAAEWDHQRDVHAELIRWLFVEPEAVRQIGPGGVRALGARVVGALDLANVHAPFGLELKRCAISNSVNLRSADIGYLSLSGSHTGEVNGMFFHIRGPVYLDSGFDASARVYFPLSQIDGYLRCAAGSFKHNKEQGGDLLDEEKPALTLGVARVRGPIWLSEGFKADGAVHVGGVTCGSLFCFGGRFINPGNVALDASTASISGVVSLGADIFGNKWNAMEVNGLVEFSAAKVGGNFIANGMKFLGKSTEPHGFYASGLSVAEALAWQDVDLNHGVLDLRSASVKVFVDDEKSWPQPGRLAIDGFTYGSIFPANARNRMRWINRESGPRPPWIVDWQSGFQPQPYRELAQVLRNEGDEAGARAVLIAEEDARYRSLGTLAHLWGVFFKYTIGYGHRPLLAIAWSLAVVLLGWGFVRIANQAGVMRLTWPETTPPPSGDSHADLYPLLYSLDVFVPFVNLHQENYWWPDPRASGECSVFGLLLRVRGSLVLYYLWFQIIVGWLLTAVFVAGVTGLIRND